MSWFSRLFSSPPPPPPPPPAHQVVIDDDLADRLGVDDIELAGVVNQTIRDYFEARRKAEEAAARGEKIPFWLRRDATDRADIEDELRDRVTQRRATETGA